MVLAHGLTTAADTVPGYIGVGFLHMLTGWDHLLFIAGVVLLAGRLRRAAATLSIFALGHSITLFTATVAGWRVSPELVDVAIALSVVFVGVVAWFGPPRDWSWFAAVVGAFGLVHGLGLATRLQALGLPQEGLIPRVLAFNLGVELGQLPVAVIIFLVGDAVRRRGSWRPLPRFAAATLAGAGLIAAVLVPLTATGELPFAPGRSTVCKVFDRPASYPAGPVGPTADFTEPTGTVDSGALGHAVAQGYVVVRYQPTLPSPDLRKLRAWIADPGTDRVAVAPARQAAAITAGTAERSLECTAFDEDALRHFAGNWLDRQPTG